MGDDLGRVEEQRALRVAEEAMRPAERILLRDTRDRKRLAGKTGKKDVVFGNEIRICRELPDVSPDRMVVREVQDVGLLAVEVPFRGEDASSADALEPKAQATYACKKVYEAEVIAPATLKGDPTLCRLPEHARGEAAGRAGAVLIPVDRPERHFQMLCCLLKRKAGSLSQG
jgi:hypothetical protein